VLLLDSTFMGVLAREPPLIAKEKTILRLAGGPKVVIIRHI
jgi:hypothetical protein